jgi:mono/diheme cytochrome c family protein
VYALALRWPFPSPSGLGRWTYPQFRRALVDGIGNDNEPLRYPVVPYRILEEQEVAAIHAYLRSVPPLRNPVPSPEPYDVAAGDRGHQVFYKYGCNGCHGDSGGRAVRPAQGTRSTTRRTTR